MTDDDDLIGEKGTRSRKRYDDDEEYHSIYIGVPAPQRRKRRRRKSTSSRDKSNENERYCETHETADMDEGGKYGYDPGNDISRAKLCVTKASACSSPGLDVELCMEKISEERSTEAPHAKKPYS
ncbi:hypothetical protein NDU88_004210 [Pleurodeles waltl]|uniref:Uncharacterized protein n=1 Tax=Pleurodeles waltl TaxID=8319 RepID=A0AAV7LL03_PLEWA|nr:hypothetical protein NDU88_004210 [Pleurodeles waltl]